MSEVEFSLVIATSRLMIASLLLVPIWSKFKWQNLQPGAILYAGVADICLAVYLAFWMTSLSYTSIIVSTTLFTTNPLLGNFLAFIGAWASSLYMFLGYQARTRGFSIRGYITVVVLVSQKK